MLHRTHNQQKKKNQPAISASCRPPCLPRCWAQLMRIKFRAFLVQMLTYGTNLVKKKINKKSVHFTRGHYLPSISMSSGSLSCCSPAFCCCCCCVWWWWFMLAGGGVVVVGVMRCSLFSLLPSTLSRVDSVGNRVLDCWWGVVGCGGGDRSSLGGRACSVANSALSAVSAGEWGGEVGGGAGRETRTYLLAIRPISAPLVGASRWLTAGVAMDVIRGGRGDSEIGGPLKLAKSIRVYPGKCGAIRELWARPAPSGTNTLFQASAKLPDTRQPNGIKGTTMKTKAHLLYTHTFNNFACDIPSLCAPPIVPRLGESGGKSYPFKPASQYGIALMLTLI